MVSVHESDLDLIVVDARAKVTARSPRGINLSGRSADTDLHPLVARNLHYASRDDTFALILSRFAQRG
jgi:hypothetical protein